MSSALSERSPREDINISPRPLPIIKRATIASINLSSSPSKLVSFADRSDTSDSSSASSPKRPPSLILKKGLTDIGLHKPGWRTTRALVAANLPTDSADLASPHSRSCSASSARNISLQYNGHDEDSIFSDSRMGGSEYSGSWSFTSDSQRINDAASASSDSSDTQITTETLRDLVQKRPSLKNLNLDEYISEDSIEMRADEFDRTVLGAGGQGRIFLATLLPSGQKVAVKVSNKDIILQEYILASKMRHPNILRPIGFSVARLSGISNDLVAPEDDEWVNMAVYEYCKYGDLVNFLERHPKLATDPAFLRRTFCSVLSALTHLHALGYVHCDIKPGNILVDENFEVKLGDLGMCQEISATMNAQGTPSYLAPEVVLAWSGRPHSHQFTDKVDIFAFGVTLVNVITGEYPFERITARLKSRVPFSGDEFEQHFNISEKCLTKLKLLDPVYATLAQTCLSIDPANRPTAQQLLALAPALAK